MQLPKEFKNRMKSMLGAEYDDFLSAYDLPVHKGIRLNTLKCNKEILEKSLGLSLAPSPFSDNLFYAPADFKPSKSAAFHAGMFYSQEPSASSVVTVLDVGLGNRVLDLCAAPGGKSTQIAAALSGTGLLVSNEIVKSRAVTLLSNIERMGVRNAVVTAEHPKVLCDAVPEFFDKVLVDAPCSGEGMFKKEPFAVEAWREDYPAECAVRQREILRSAVGAIAKGGELVYSTCTFSYEENEGMVKWLLDEYNDLQLVKISVPFGRLGIDDIGVRIYPMDGGEGHFIAKLKKIDGHRQDCEFMQITREAGDAKALYAECFTDKPKNLYEIGDKTLILPENTPRLAGVHILRAGVLLCERKGKRLEPAHAAFMAANKSVCRNAIEIADSDISSFLHGEEIDSDKKGYTAVCIDGVVTGFGKSSDGRLKNKYPKGLRI